MRKLAVRFRVSQAEGEALAFPDGKIADGLEIVAVERHRRAQHNHVGTGDRARRVAVDARQPRHRLPVSEAQDEFAVQIDLAVLAGDHAHEMRVTVARRHEVGEHRAAGVGLEAGLEDERVRAITPRDPGVGVVGADQPATVIRRAEERREAGIRIETRPAQPVDRSVTADQGGAAQVSDQGIVFDTQGHEVLK